MNLNGSKMKNFKFVLATFVGLYGLIVLAYFVLTPRANIDNFVQLRLEHQKEKTMRDELIQQMHQDSIRPHAKDDENKLNSLFKQWDIILEQEHALFRAEQNSAQQSIAIWLSIIAAICTILPIVIGINQNMNFNSQVEAVRKGFEDDVNEAKGNLEKELKFCKTEIEQYKQMLLKSKMAELVNGFSINLRILAELEEIEIHQNVLLTCPQLLMEQLTKLEKQSQSFLNDYTRFLDENKTKDESDEKKTSKIILEVESQLRERLVDVYVLMNNLLKKYESCFDNDLIFRVHDVMDQLWYKIDNILKIKKTSDIDVHAHLLSICHYTSCIKSIFQELINCKL